MPKTYQHQKWGQRKPILFDRSQKGPEVTEPSAGNSCSFIQNFVHYKNLLHNFKDWIKHWSLSTCMLGRTDLLHNRRQMFLQLQMKPRCSAQPQAQFLLSHYCSQPSSFGQFLSAALKALCESQFHGDFHGFELALDQALNIQIWDCVRI